MRDNFLGLCGIAKKAGKVVFGFNETEKAVKQHKVFIVICAFDASEKTVKEAEFICNMNKIPILKTTYKMEELGKAIGEKATAVLSVADEGLAKKIEETYSGNINTGGAKA